MTDLLLNTSGDLSIVGGDLVLTTTLEQRIRQQVQITLRTFRGEWKYNTKFGPPYVSNENNPIQILGKVRKNILDLHMREAILSVGGVIAITEYSSVLDFPSQIVTLEFRAAIESGEITDTIEFSI